MPGNMPAFDLAYLGLIVPGLLLVGIAFIRWNDAQLYGQHYSAAARATRRAASGGKRFFLWAGRFLVVSALFLPLPLFVDVEGLSVRLSALAPTIAGLSFISLTVGLATTHWVTAPPGVLVLGASSSNAGRALVDLMFMQTGGHRVMFFFDPNALHRAVAGRSLRLDEASREIYGNMYQRGRVDWEKVVVPLMVLAPVIVVDATTLSDGLVAEISRITKDPKLARKTIVYHLPGRDFRADDFVQRISSILAVKREPRLVVETARLNLLQHRRRNSQPQQQDNLVPGIRVMRNPHLPLVMECPKTEKTFRLGVNSAVWEMSAGGNAKCPICGEMHAFNRQNTRSVAWKEAESFPRG